MRLSNQYKATRRGALAVLVSAALTVSVLGVANAALQLADDSASASAARLQATPRPTATPRATASPTATPTPSPPTPPCAFSTVGFNGADYCPATIGAVRGTFYGTGTRVVLRAVTVTAVTSRAITVAAWAAPPCPPGKYCGAGMTLQSLTVTWSGPSRPAYGDVLDLFGRTVPNSITPVGYIKTGWCPIEWC